MENLRFSRAPRDAGAEAPGSPLEVCCSIGSPDEVGRRDSKYSHDVLSARLWAEGVCE